MRFLNDETVKAKLATAKKLVDVDEKDYCAIFYVGGHGPMLDLATDPVNARLASQVCSRVVARCSPFSHEIPSFTKRGKS